LLRARVDNGAAAIPALITALERSGLRVGSATVARPSLDDVYLRHAGRSFQQADTETHNEAKEVAA
jgi:ABC-2 type transport system ATP-binding protein